MILIFNNCIDSIKRLWESNRSYKKYVWLYYWKGFVFSKEQSKDCANLDENLKAD